MDTRITFTQALEKLRHDVLDMASRAEDNLGKALAALKNNDRELAKEVKDNDAIINAKQLEIEDETSICIATQQPVAGDLREMVTIFKITGSLERVGDHAVHLAKAAIKLSKDPPFRAIEHIEKMAETGQEMLRSSIGAFLAKDAAEARRVAEMDTIIDTEHKLLTEELLELIKKQKVNVKKAVRLLNTSGYLERLGDHITNICESIIYMIEAKHVELND